MELRYSLLAKTPVFYHQSADLELKSSVRPNAADWRELRIKFERLAKLVPMSLIRPLIPASRVAGRVGLHYVTLLSLSTAFLPLDRIRSQRKQKGVGGKVESWRGTEGTKVFIVKS